MSVVWCVSLSAAVGGCAAERQQDAGPTHSQRSRVSLQRVAVSPDLEPMLAECIEGDAPSCEKLGRYLDGGPYPDREPEPCANSYLGTCGEAIPMLAQEPAPPRPEVTALYDAAARFRRADCEAGDAEACDGLAEQIEHGRGLPRDEAKAAVLHERATELRVRGCEANEAEACLALSHASSGKLARDYEYRACAAGDLDTCRELSEALENGRLQPDMRERERFVAAYWKRQTKRGGIGGSLFAGAMGQDAPTEAFVAACKAKDPEACYVAASRMRGSPFEFAMVMAGASAFDEEPSEPSKEEKAAAEAAAERAREAQRQAIQQQAALSERARRLFERDCKAGDARACWSRGHMHEESKEFEAARARYEQACAADEAKGCLAQARLIFALAEEPADMGAALEWLTRSCEFDASHGCGELALIFECGLGIEADAARAAELYARACEGETRAACRRFE